MSRTVSRKLRGQRHRTIGPDEGGWFSDLHAADRITPGSHDNANSRQPCAAGASGMGQMQIIPPAFGDGAADLST